MGQGVWGGGSWGGETLAPPLLAGLLLLFLLLAWNGCLIEGDSFRAGKRDKLVPGVFKWRM